MERGRGRRPLVVRVIAARIKCSNRYRICERCKKRNAGSDTNEREHHDFAKECLLIVVDWKYASMKNSLRYKRSTIVEEKAFYNRRLSD